MSTLLTINVTRLGYSYTTTPDVRSYDFFSYIETLKSDVITLLTQSFQQRPIEFILTTQNFYKYKWIKETKRSR